MKTKPYRHSVVFQGRSETWPPNFKMAELFEKILRGFEDLKARKKSKMKKPNFPGWDFWKIVLKGVRQ